MSARWIHHDPHTIEIKSVPVIVQETEEQISVVLPFCFELEIAHYQADGAETTEASSTYLVPAAHDQELLD